MILSDRGRAPAAEQDPAMPGSPPAPVPQEPPYQETHVIDAALPSAVDGYDFLFSATVWWRPVSGQADGPEAASPALAAATIVSRALEVVRHEEPGRASFTRYLLEGELSVPLPDRSSRVTAMAGDVTLSLGAGDDERLRKLSDLRKDEEVWDYERHQERSRRRYLGDDVLKSAGSAVVWWLTRHEDEIEKAVDMIGPLARIAAAANNEEVPELFRHLVAPPPGTRTGVTVGGPPWGGSGNGEGESMPEHGAEGAGLADQMHEWLTALNLKPGTDQCTVFVHHVVQWLADDGLHEAADEIRRTFLPAPDANSAHPPAKSPSEDFEDREGNADL
jgi:hypothetical protein